MLYTYWAFQQNIIRNICLAKFTETPPPKKKNFFFFFKETPALYPPHSPSWTALWLQWSHSDWHHHLSGPEVGHSHRLHGEKGPAEAVLSSPAEEVQPATGTVDTVLLCHHWIRPLHINNCLVQLRYQIWSQRVVRTAERIIGTTLPTLQELYSSRESKRADRITLDPHIQHTPSLNCYRLVDATENKTNFLFVTYTIIQSITSSEMCSLHLTHPSAADTAASGEQSGVSVPCSRVSPQSWTIPAGAGIQTHNLGLQVQRSIH